MTRVGRIVLESSQMRDMTPEDGLILGRALAMDNRRVVVARDLMRSSSMIADAVTAGLLFQGADVVDLGVLSLPAAAVNACEGDCLVYVAGRTGLISGCMLWNPDGGPFSEEQIRHLDMVLDKPPEAPSHEGLGRRLVRDGSTERYNRSMAARFEGEVKCSVIVDCRCGTASGSLPQLLNGFGADVLTLNAHEDRDFRDVRKEDDETRTLEDIVAASAGSIGFRMNGIGTVVEVIAEGGEPLTEDQVFALLMLYLRPGSVAVTANSTALFGDILRGDAGVEVSTPYEAGEDAGGVVLTAEDPSAVSDAVIAGADLGFYHGTVMFRDGAVSGDGIRTAATLVKMASDNSLRKIADALPSYHRSSSVRKTAMKADTFRRVIEESLGDVPGETARYGNAFRQTLDHGWFLIRHRLDEEQGAVIEIIGESLDRAYLAGLMKMADEVVDGVLKQLRRRYTISRSTGSPRESYARQLVLS